MALVAVAVLLVPAVSWAGVDEVARSLASRAAELMEAFKQWDATAGRKGYSEAVTSGQLAWGEANYLRRFMLAYAATGDTHWLDRMIEHCDRMLAVLSDPDGDGYLGWQDRVYSIGIGEVEPEAVGELELRPAVNKQYNKKLAMRVTGHEYAVELAAVDRVVVRDLTTGEKLGEAQYKGRLAITQISGLRFVLEGPGRAGTRFFVRTTAPEACEYQVHDGMVLYPMALFVEAVRKAGLGGKYEAAARRYAWLMVHFLRKWEATWKDLGDAGLYCFTRNRTQRYPGYSLPHNQYLALARAWLVMSEVDGAPERELFRERAVKMGRYFKRHLRERDGAYVWNYWDPLPEEAGVRRYVEDTSHGTIDVSFVVEAFRRGVVFDRDDMKRFGRTYARLVWKGPEEPLKYAARVDGSGTARHSAGRWEWPLLGIYDDAAFEAAVGAFAALREIHPASAPVLLYVLKARGYLK